MARAPACALGFSASFAAGTLTMNFNLGTDIPATFDIALVECKGAVRISIKEKYSGDRAAAKHYAELVSISE